VLRGVAALMLLLAPLCAAAGVHVVGTDANPTRYVPSGHSTIQAAIDACGEGDTAKIGCDIVIRRGVYAESISIGGSTDLTLQYGIRLRAEGSAGRENSNNTNTCAVTLTGDDTASNNVITVNGVIGLEIDGICIDMDDAATNDPLNGIAISPAGTTVKPVKHFTFRNMNIQGAGAVGGAGIYVGDNASADIAFGRFERMRIEDVRTCYVNDSLQAIDLTIDLMECVDPTATIGGIDIQQSMVHVRDFYFSPGAASQIGIQYAGGTLPADIQSCNFEWDEDNGTMIMFDATGNTGARRGNAIRNCRMQPQMQATSRHVCIDWNKRGSLLVDSVSFESSDANFTCELDLNNPDTAIASRVTMIGSHVKFGADGSASDNLTINRTSTGGAEITLTRFDRGRVEQCHGTSSCFATATDANGLYYDADDDGTRDTTEGGGGSYTHATDCTALTVGGMGDRCWEQDQNDTFICEPTAGGCDTAGEWIQEN
jgi:hypothetical protein